MEGEAPAAKPNGKIAVKVNVALASLTTFGIGGAARHFCAVTAEAQIGPALEFAARQRLPVFVLGGGSNVLVADAGFPGLVLAVRIVGRRRSGAEVEIGAGETWDDVVAWCVEQDLAGLECLSGIPGSTGGTPIQNVGAYGQEVAESIAAVRAWDRKTQEMVELGPAECLFGYRSSRFNTTDAGRYVVASVRFALRPGGPPAVRYPDLRRHLAGMTPTLAGVRDTVYAIRRDKGMVVDGSEWGSAGSYFKNPVLSAEQYETLAHRAGLPRGDHLPLFSGPDGQTKTSAAWLIEHAGFAKGYRPSAPDGQPGPAGLSPRHTLALVNFGGARAADILRLQAQIQTAVEAKFGIRLEPEPIFVGEPTAAGAGAPQ
ncbi:MAG: UDP-N-acetylmuramate dehydrogenase [Terriglobales bacterium]